MKTYIVSVPDEFRRAFKAISIFGLIFAIIFIGLTYLQVKGASFGYILLGLSIFLVGLVGSLYYRRWSIEVVGDQLRINYLLRKAKDIGIKDLDRVVISRKSQISLIIDEKKIVNVDRVLVNYNKLLRQLEEENISFDYD